MKFLLKLKNAVHKRITSIVALTLFSPAVFANNGAGGVLPWEGPLATFVTSITGPVAIGISLVAIVAAGATLIFGGEVSEFVRRMIMVILVIALIVAAAGVLTSLFGVTAAVVI